MSSNVDPSDQRILKMLLTLFDFSFGTLWWVRESVWKAGFKAAGQPYHYANARDGHPGVSIRVQSGFDGIAEAVPLLHGASKSGQVRVTGFSGNDASRETLFGGIIAPAKVPLDDFLYAAEDADNRVTAGPLMARKKVVANLQKPKLSEEEATCLRAFLVEKGIL